MTSLLHVFYQFWHADYKYDIFKMKKNGYYDFWTVWKGPSAPTMRPAHQQKQYGGFYFQHTNALSAHQHIFSAPTAQWIVPISISHSSVFSAPVFCQRHQYFFIDTSASNSRAPTHFQRTNSTMNNSYLYLSLKCFQRTSVLPAAPAFFPSTPVLQIPAHQRTFSAPTHFQRTNIQYNE